MSERADRMMKRAELLQRQGKDHEAELVKRLAREEHTIRDL